MMETIGMSDNVDKASDAELASNAELGLRGQGAVVEMMRRLRQTLQETSGAADKLNKRLLYYSVAIFFVALLQLAVFVWSIVAG
jgi:hypothetical protein